MGLSQSTNNDLAAAKLSPSQSEGGSQRGTSVELPENKELQREWPQEILDMIWNEAMAPWSKKRVIVLDHVGGKTFVCGNTRDLEAGRLVGNIRRLNRKAQDEVSSSLRKAGREMFPKVRDPSSARRHESFKGLFADFEHDIFFLSLGFLYGRCNALNNLNLYAPDAPIDESSQDPPQPAHMMLPLILMMAVIERVFEGDMPCVGYYVPPHHPPRPVRDFGRLLDVYPRSGPPRMLTVLIPRSVNEKGVMVDYDGLERRPFGTSMEAKASVYEMAKSQEDKKRLRMVYNGWGLICQSADIQGVQLPALEFACSRS